MQESGGKAAPVRTYQDLLHDHARRGRCSSITAPHNWRSSVRRRADKPKVQNASASQPFHIGSDPSPDGQRILVSPRAHTRRSRTCHPFTARSRVNGGCVQGERRHEDWHGRGTYRCKTRCRLKACQPARAAVRWVPTLRAHAHLGGSARRRRPQEEGAAPRQARSPRPLAARSRAAELLKIEHRFAGLDFFPTGNRMLVRDYDRDRKWVRTFLAPTTAILADEPKLLFERSVQDRYGDPWFAGDAARCRAAIQSFGHCRRPGRRHVLPAWRRCFSRKATAHSWTSST